MVTFVLRINNYPEEAGTWKAGWYSRRTPVPAVSGAIPIEVEEEAVFDVPDGLEEGFLTVECVRKLELGGGTIPPPAIAPDRDAWRTYTTIESGSYTFNWQTGKLSKGTVVWPWLLVAALAFVGLVQKIRRR